MTTHDEGVLPDAGALPPMNLTAMKPSALPEMTNAELADRLDGENERDCPPFTKPYKETVLSEAAKRLRALAAATEEKEKADAEDVTGNGPFWRWFTAIWPEPKGSPQQRSNWAFKRDMAHAGWCAAETKLTELERENRELREDRDRIDSAWLWFKQRTSDENCINTIVDVFTQMRQEIEDGATFRAAIDTAIESAIDAARNGGAT